MAWIESHQELRDHPKRKRLSRILDISRRETIGLLHELWWWAYDYAPEGDLSAFTDEDIADAIDWERDPGALVEALVEAGFINADRQIHDWEDFAQKWIDRRQADKERKRAKRGKPISVPEASAGHPSEDSPPSGVTGPNRTGPNQTGPDTSPPTPSPHSGKGDAAGAAARNTRGGKRNGVVQHDEPTAEPIEDPERTPATPGDRELWNLARAAAAEGLSNGNAEALGLLVPLGRAADGGLHLRAPPGLGLGKFTNHVVRALLDAGDEHAAQVAIVEGRPGESKG
jgi:hypothetical protein